jgi:FkbM family methyltransferase
LKREVKDLISKFLPRSIVREYRHWRLRKQLASFQPRIAEHRYGANRRKVLLADPTAERWYDRDWDEPVEIKCLREGRIGQGSRVFDLGAHQGIVAMLLADIVGPTGQVVAVEASLHNFAIAKENVRINDVACITVHHAAVSERNGWTKITDETNCHVQSGSSVNRLVDVPSITVDELSTRFGLPDVLFIDVEGYEERVLRGAFKTLSSGPDVLIEVHVGCGLEQYGASVRDVVSHLIAHSYNLLALPINGDRALRFQEAHDVTKSHFYLLGFGCQKNEHTVDPT